VGAYIIRRLLALLPTVMLLLFLVVLMISMIPGDIIDLMLEEKSTVNPENRAILEEKLGLDDPLVIRYFKYLGGLARGDLGESLWTEKSVTSLIAPRIWPTMEIGLVSIGLGAVMGIVIGVISAIRQDSFADYFLRGFATLGNSVPNFALATAVIVLPALWWGRTPNLRYVTLTEDPIGHLKILILPAIILSTGLATTLMRLTRTMMLEVLRQDYVRTARAKGLREWEVLTRHAMKNALIPVVTVLGLQIAFLLSGSVITESVFAIPGVGRLLINSIQNRDYPIVQAIVVMIGLFVIVTNLIIDVSYAWLDPRIKFD
jgi:peptide/nickel transport system permease protein